MADKWVQLKSANGDRLFPASKMDLLWTNASPSSNFAAQTLDLNLTNYKYLLIFYTHTTGNIDVTDNTILNSAIVVKGIGPQRINASKDNLCYRFISSVIDTGITFGEGFYFSSYNSSTKTTGTGVAIPRYIYGIK